MRKPIVLVSLVALAACGGGGPQTAGGTPVTGGGSTVGNASDHTFTAPTVTKTYSAIGGVQHFAYSTDSRKVGQYNELYAANASTARNSAMSVTYNPRDAIFELTIADTAANVSKTLRFQDPAHRTDFGGLSEPQDGTPNISGKNIRYLQAGSSSGQLSFDPVQSDTFPVGSANASRDVSTFFYQKPGSSTQYVTYAGFVRNSTSIVEVDNTAGGGSTYLKQNHVLERAAFVFGERSDNNAVPKSGTATFTGDMIATMVYNPLIDTQADAPTYYHWITGSGTTSVNFGTSSVTSSFTGTVDAPQFDVNTSRTHVLDAGATFAASATASIDLVNKGGFAGQVGSASFTQGGVTTPVAIAGSSIDGAFYGPDANEIGGGFRIVGGTPDERIDILGAFVGKK